MASMQCRLDSYYNPNQSRLMFSPRKHWQPFASWTLTEFCVDIEAQAHFKFSTVSVTGWFRICDWEPLSGTKKTWITMGTTIGSHQNVSVPTYHSKLFCIACPAPLIQSHKWWLRLLPLWLLSVIENAWRPAALSLAGCGQCEHRVTLGAVLVISTFSWLICEDICDNLGVQV